MPARACVGTAYTIEFDMQVGIVCLPGRGEVGFVSKSDHAPPFVCSARTFAKANSPHRTPLKSAFFACPDGSVGRGKADL